MSVSFEWVCMLFWILVVEVVARGGAGQGRTNATRCAPVGRGGKRAAEGRLAHRLVAGRRHRGRAGRLAVGGRARAWPDRERTDAWPGA